MSDVKEPIAERTLRAGNSVILVTIGKPEEHEDDYLCNYSIDAGGKKKVSYAIGMDSVQALQLAMKKINADLVCIGHELGESVSWLEDTPGESGFLD